MKTKLLLAILLCTILFDASAQVIYDEEGRFIAIYAFVKEKYMFQIVKMFFDKNEKN